jgi:hypothetical protein
MKEQYQVKISNRFSTWENLDGGSDADISRAWKGIRESMEVSPVESPDYYEL